MIDDSIPDDEIVTEVKLEDILPTGLNLDDKQLLLLYRNAFAMIITRQNTMAKVTNAVRNIEYARQKNQKNYEKVGYAIGAFVIAAAVPIIQYLIHVISSLTGHKGS